MKILEVNKLDAHDRLEHLKKTQSAGIEEMVNNIISEAPFGKIPFYIYAHKRSGMDGNPDRIIWQPRLTKPTAETNSMLFKVNPLEPDQVKIIWMIPDPVLWPSYLQNALFESSIVAESIRNYQKNRRILEAKESDDLSDEKIDSIYKNMKDDKKMKE